MNTNANLESFSYDDKIVRMFLWATLLWGAVAMLVGLIIASQLSFWQANFGLEWLTFGRLRPLHTNAAIFAFTGNGIFAGVYHSTQRLCKTRMFSEGLSKLHFWGWNMIIVAAAITLPLGFSQAKEYAELEWPLDIGITLIWVVFAINFFMTLKQRREKHIYVALWFYISTIITVAVLHIVNSIEIPVSLMQSYPVYAGVQDALVQWWYGHNAVAFFLTTPFLGLMYYYLPKMINRPIYSYRLSIIHFWTLIFLYIWAGPHHLLYTSLPDWAQTLGMVFSLMLWAPSWGGMINGLLTMRGAWDRVRQDPALKFSVLAITFYGMSTFEGPLLSIKSVSALAHYTDWIIAHVHGGTLGWNYGLLAAMMLYLFPKLWNTTLYSVKLANAQFYTATVGMVLYIVALWAAGITQGLMWWAIDDGGQLVYPDFVETVMRIMPLYHIRVVGGTLVLISFLMMLYNLIKTAQKGTIDDSKVYQAPAMDQNAEPNAKMHRKLEGMPFVFTVWALIAILVGSVIEIAPSILSNNYIVKDSRIKPYTPLELAGRDIYVKEGCYTCHSQQIRPMADEALRYGAPSEASESIYDRPFQWGSRRIGPDLARIGKKYPDVWHLRHMMDPRSVVPKSIMPVYTWLFTNKTEYKVLTKKLKVMKSLGVPYTDHEIQKAVAIAKAQAAEITRGLADAGIDMKMQDKQIIAMIAYLQRLGTDLMKEKQE